MYRRSLPTLTLLALGAFSFPAVAGDDIKAENPLVRPPGAPDPDAKGHVRAEFEPDKDRHRLKIEAEQIDTSLSWECYLADAGGVLQFVGNIPYDDVGEVEIEFDTKEGGLPFGASTVSSLAGRAVEVRSGGATYLVGTVPSLNGGGGGGGSGGGGGGDDIKVKSFLTRASTSPDPNASGYVELRKKSGGDQKFKVEADHIDPSIDFSVWVETSVGSGLLTSAGAMGPEDFDEVELELETEDGAALPNGATDVSTLAGLRVEVRDATNAVYLEGVVPSITGGGSGTSGTGNDKAKATFSGSGGKVELELKAKNSGNQEFELEVKKLKLASSVQLMVFDGSQGTLVPVASLGLNGGGNGKLRIVTKKGQPLPLGVLSLSDLANAAFELRDATSGTVLISGTIPKL